MVRFLVPALVVLCAGCCGQPGATTWSNPFDYHSRIGPPPTGSAVPATTPYYQPSPSGTLQPPLGTQGSSPTPASSQTLAKAPPRRTSTGGTGFREVRTRDGETSKTRLVIHTETTPKPTLGPNIRVVEPSAKLSPTATSSRTFTPSPARDISTLPPADPPTRVVVTAPPKSQPRRPASQSRTNFGYKEDYSRLQGRLEYSATSDQWKLRYIPIDGKTDRYGGSVVLVDKKQLADLQDGDFVSVDGELGRDGQDAVGFAPAYHASGIRRL